MTARLYTHPPGALNGAADTYAKGVCDVGDGLVFSADASGALLVVTKVLYDGTQAWQRSYASSSGGAMQPDGSGGFYLLGYGVASTLSLLHIDTNGTLLWSRWPDYETGYDDWKLSRLGSYDCLLAVRSGVTTKLIAFAASGATLYEEIYTGITGEETGYSPLLALAGDASGYMLASRLNTTNDYLRVSKLNSTLTAVSLTKSYKISGSDSYWYLYDSCQLDGMIALAFVVGAPAATLRLMCVQPAGTIYWTKHVTDTGIADFNSSGAEIFGDTQGVFGGGVEGFFVTSFDDTDGAVLYRFLVDGTLEWSKTIKTSNTVGNSSIENVLKLADGRVVVVFNVQHPTTDLYDASFLILNADGTPNSNFLSAVVEVTARTGITVSAGTDPTVASDTAGTISTPTTTLVNSGVTLNSTNYSLEYFYPDDFQTKIAAGTKEVFHGTANSPYLQSKIAIGTSETKHGVAVSIQGLPEGATVCTAIGTKEVFHGSAVGKSPFASPAAGLLTAKHGTAISRMSCTATGHVSILHGTAKSAVIGQATGSKNTKYGLAKTLLPGTATGILTTKHGRAVSDWGIVGVATGRKTALHGTASSKSVFKATGSFKTRYGTAKAVRSITC